MWGRMGAVIPGSTGAPSTCAPTPSPRFTGKKRLEYKRMFGAVGGMSEGKNMGPDRVEMGKYPSRRTL